MGTKSFLLALILAALTATLVTMATGGTVAAGPGVRLQDVAKAQIVSEAMDVKDLEVEAQRVLQILTSKEFEKLHGELAPWVQAAQRLRFDRALQSYQDKEMTWKQIQVAIRLSRLDPEGQLGLGSIKELRALPPGKSTALLAQCFARRSSGKPKIGAASEWRMTRIGVGLLNGQQIGGTVLLNGGGVRFATISGNTLEILYSYAAGTWYLEEFRLMVGEDLIAVSADTASGWEYGPSHIEKVVEAQAALRTVGDRLRTYYYLNDESIAGFSFGDDAVADLDPIELDGEYYHRYVLNLKPENDGRGTTIIAYPRNSEALVVVMRIDNIRTGETSFWFGYLEELEDHLKQSAKDLKDSE